MGQKNTIRGRLVLIKSDLHGEDQLVRHARLVVRGLGFVDKEVRYYPGIHPNVFQMIEDRKRSGAAVYSNNQAEIWIQGKFIHWFEFVEHCLREGFIVFARDYVPTVAAKLGQLAATESRRTNALSFASQFSTNCYERYGIHKPDAVIVVADERFDHKVVQYGSESVAINADPMHIERRNLMLALGEGDPNWHVIRAGLPEIPTNGEGAIVFPENKLPWRDYEEVEREVIRAVLPPGFDIGDEEIMEWIGKVRFQKADQV